VIFVARARANPIDLIARAREQLSKVNACLIGGILNEMAFSRTGYYSGYYYYGYSRYYRNYYDTYYSEATEGKGEDS